MHGLIKGDGSMRCVIIQIEFFGPVVIGACVAWSRPASFRCDCVSRLWSMEIFVGVQFLWQFTAVEISRSRNAQSTSLTLRSLPLLLQKPNMPITLTRR